MNWERILDDLVLPFAKLLEPREGSPGTNYDIIIGFGIGMRPRGLPSVPSLAVAFQCS